MLSSPVVWGGMINNFCYGYFTFYCMTWMPAYLVEQRGLSLGNRACTPSSASPASPSSALAAGWAADRLIARGGDAVLVRKSFVIAGFIGGTTVLLGAYAPTRSRWRCSGTCCRCRCWAWPPPTTWRCAS
jgi:ACS family D-galactonate transporter-like MFS transporter